MSEITVEEEDDYKQVHRFETEGFRGCRLVAETSGHDEDPEGTMLRQSDGSVLVELNDDSETSFRFTREFVYRLLQIANGG